MIDNVLSLLSTAGWVVVVSAILALFGRTEGGGWSIASGVARGVTSWAGSRVRSGIGASPRSRESSPAAASSAAPIADASRTAETEDLGTRPT